MPDFECQVSQDGEQQAAEVALLAQNSARTSALEAAARQTLSAVHGRQREAAASRYKVSRYDIPVRLADGAALLFNSRTRSLILLSDGEASAYRELAERSDFSAGQVSDRLLLEALAGGGHVVGAMVDELAVVRDSYEATRSAKGSLTITIAPTMACNFACGYCFQGLNKPTTKMKPDVQNAIVDFVKAKKDLKSLNIVWYGGEPLMGKESIFRLSDLLISYCDKHKISYSAGIVSNAWFLNGEMAAQLYTRRVRWVQVTIDGDRGTHDRMRPLTSGQGTFDRILDNIAEALDQTAISINARVNVGQSNVDNVDAMLDCFVERNFAKRGNFSVYFAPIEASTPESGSAFEERLSRAEFNRKVLASGGAREASWLRVHPGAVERLCRNVRRGLARRLCRIGRGRRAQVLGNGARSQQADRHHLRAGQTPRQRQRQPVVAMDAIRQSDLRFVQDLADVRRLLCDTVSSTAIRKKRRCPVQAGNGIRPNTSSVAPRISAWSRLTNGCPRKQPSKPGNPANVIRWRRCRPPRRACWRR